MSESLVNIDKSKSERQLDFFKGLEEDDYNTYLEKIPADKLSKIKKSVKRMQTGVHASAPLTCLGPENCPFIRKCPIPTVKMDGTLDDGKPSDYPLGKECIMEKFYVEQKIVNLEILKKLCNNNKDIVTVYNTGDFKNGWRGGSGPHTHERMTHPTCIRKMKCDAYINYLQHASGMIIMKKTDKIVKFVEEWLYFNKIPECSSMSSKQLEETNTEFVKKVDKYFEYIGGGDYYIYWSEGVIENTRLQGHRHDQSISGLLLNKMGHKLIYIKKSPFFGRFNFLEYCRYDQQYKFIDSMRSDTAYDFERSSGTK